MALVAHRRPDPATLESWFAPLWRDRGVRRDVAKLLRAISSRDTMAAARAFPSFRQPVLLAWGEEDFLFPISDAERLQRAFPDARLARIARARCFVPEDQPERLTELIAAFLAETAIPDVGVARQA